MGDSETDCSQIEDECDSPILYTGKRDVPIREQPELSNNGLFALSQLDSFLAYPENQSHRAIQPENPPYSSIQPSVVPFAVPQSKTSVKNSAHKVRTLDQVLNQLSKITVNKTNLMYHLEANDMRLLIHACGERVVGSTSKGNMSDFLLQLFQQGTLNQLCNTLNRPLLVDRSGTGSISLPAVRQPSKGSSETQLETHSSIPTVRETIAEPAGKTPLVPAQNISHQPKVLFLAEDPSLWQPIVDAAVLRALEGEGEGDGKGVPRRRSAGAATFAPLPKGSSIYFADVDSAMWRPCNSELQVVLNETDPAYTSKRMLQQLHDTSGIFSALPIESARRTAATAGAAAEKDGGGSSTGSSDDTCSASSDATYDLAALSHADSAVHTAVHARARAPVAASPPPSVAAQQKQRGDGDRDSSNKYLEVVHSLRRMLAPGSPPASSALSSASASAGHLHLQHTHQQQHRFPTAGGGSATGTVLVPSFQYDCIKHVTFRHAKLGLSLVRQEVVGAAGRETITGTGTGTGKVSGKVEERIVIQAKSHGQLESAADKLLSIGDVLVTVNHCEVGSCGVGFTEQLAFLRDAPRPVLLGFVPAVAMRR